MYLKGKKGIYLFIIMIFAASLFIGCGGGEVDDYTPVPDETTPTAEDATPDAEATPEPADIELPDILKDGSESILKVYDVNQEKIVELTVREYLYGVVAGEVGNDWPEEILKAQAIIARTYLVDHFTEGNSSMYEGADISTDVSESQAYNADDINDAIKKAVDDTVGTIMLYDGEVVKAFFHSCSGGMTASAVEGLEHEEDLNYLQPVQSDDSNAPPENREWSAEYPKEKLQAALASMEEDIGDFDTVEIGDTGPSGRALTLKFGEAEVSCPQLRLAISASDFRSTLITDLTYENDVLKVSGKGFGHGVGMPQWDAKQLAEDGKSAEDIILTYFLDIDVVTIWE